MVTILLEQIIELLKGFIDSFKDHAAEVAEKLGLISEDTSDINDNTDTIVTLDSAIKDNTDILVANTGAIKNSSQATSVNTAAISSDTTVIRNNINTISINSGKTAAFTEDTATNTLNTLNKVTTIASDTTQIRHVDTNIYSRLNTIYTQLDWLLYGVDFINEISGASPIVFNTDKPLIPIKKIISNIVAIQDLHGYSKPWSGGSGKNKFNCTATTETRNGVTLTVVKNSANQVTQINVTGTATAGVSFTLGTATIEAGTYVLNGYTGGSSVGTKYINYSGIANAYGSNVTSTISETKTTTASLQIASGAETDFTIYPMIRLSNTSADYEPYSNICPISGFSDLTVTLADGDMQTVDTKTINFGQTVYGGVADVTNGKVTLTHGYLFVDGSTSVVSVGQASGLNYVIVSNTGIDSINTSATHPIVSNEFDSSTIIAVGNAYITGYGKTLVAILPDQTVTTVAQANAWFSNNNAQFVYELATPIEITINPISIEQTLGDNIITTNTNGDLNIAYIESVRNHINS